MFQVTDGHLVGFYIVVYLVCSNILVEGTSSSGWLILVQVDAVIIGRRVQDLHWANGSQIP